MEKPKPMAVCVEEIPAELRALPRWVVWDYVECVDPETGEVDFDKPPRCPRGGPASSTDPATWCPFDEAHTAYRRGGYAGMGFVLHREPGEEDGLVGMDLDHC